MIGLLRDSMWKSEVVTCFFFNPLLLLVPRFNAVQLTLCDSCMKSNDASTKLAKIITKPDKRFASVVWVLLDVLGFLSLGLAWSQSHWCWFVHLLYDELEPVFVFLGSHFWHLRDHGHYFIWCSWSCSSFLLSIGGLWGRLGGSILRMIKGMVERDGWVDWINTSTYYKVQGKTPTN